MKTASDKHDDSLDNDDIRRAVRTQYAQVVNDIFGSNDSGCCTAGCCTVPAVSASNVDSITRQLGYSAEELHAVPHGANLGLGCGNPQAIAALKPGEVVLDLGSGAGFDCFLAARQVGDAGRVIGVDMTPEMIARARANAGKAGITNVEFRLGEIEHLPVADASVDVIISNCVINLSPDKPRVFAEAWRALKPGGRLAIADVVAFAPLPENIRNDMQLYTGCMAGASLITEIESMLAAQGFTQIRVTPRDESRRFIRDWAPGTDVADYVVSATIEAMK